MILQKSLEHFGWNRVFRPAVEGAEPEDGQLRMAIADDVLARHAEYRGTISEALTILRLFVDSGVVDIDLIVRSSVLGLVPGFFERDYRDHWPAAMYFMETCVRRPELRGWSASLDVIDFAEKMLPVVRLDPELEGFCCLLSSVLALDPTPIATLIGGGFFPYFLAVIDRAAFGPKREFSALVVTVVSLVGAEELEALMSEPLVEFFFDFLEADSETALRSVRAFVALCERGVKFGMSQHHFVVRLIRFLEGLGDEVSDLVDGLIDG
jgi:hypothetical protein